MTDDRWTTLAHPGPKYMRTLPPQVVRYHDGRWVPRIAMHLGHKIRRDNLRRLNLCINSGPRSQVVHGLVVRGGKCQRCIDVHKGGPIEAHRD